MGVMDTGSWRVVFAVNDHDLDLAVAEDGRWVVGRDAESARPVSEVMMVLLPLLKRPYRQVTAAVAAQAPSGQPELPWEELVRFALTWPSDYWPGLALGWLEDGFGAGGVLDELAALKDASGRSQPLRHRALRVWKAARG
jgi:hypothetical protein